MAFTPRVKVDLPCGDAGARVRETLNADLEPIAQEMSKGLTAALQALGGSRA